MPIYRLHDTTGDDLGLLEHPAPNLGPGDVVELEDGREALVTARVETDGEPIEALLELITDTSSFEVDVPMGVNRVSAPGVLTRCCGHEASPARARSTVPGAPGVRFVPAGNDVVTLSLRLEVTRTRRREGRTARNEPGGEAATCTPRSAIASGS